MHNKYLKIALIILIGIILFIAFTHTAQYRMIVVKIRGKRTLSEQLSLYGPGARKRLSPAFNNAGVNYPPKQIVLVALKEENEMQLYAGKNSSLYLIKTYPILAASGTVGPKLKEGDRQVPEGIYRVVFLNPNSLYHLSLRLDYPNNFDRKIAKLDNRKNLGGDIMIHGSNCSIGCLAMGDEAAEELFVLAADTGIGNIKVIISPLDMRKHSAPKNTNLPKWTGELYKSIEKELNKL